MNTLVTIIVPVYKAECFIERCAESLFAQTYGDIEYFFVNDCTPDNSIKLLETTLDKYPSRKDFVRILNFDSNRGHAHARNVALKQCHGEYVIQIDADDWVEITMIEKMLKSAKDNDSDIVVCDFFIEKRNSSIYKNVEVSDITREGLKEFKWILDYSAHWNKLIRTSLIIKNNIYCLEGTNNWVDVGQIAPLRFIAQKISIVKEGLYHYNSYNEHSVSRNITDKRIDDMLKVASYVYDFISQRTTGDFEMSLQYLLFVSKLRMIDSQRHEYERWLSTFPISNNYILDYPLPIIRKFLYWLVAHHLFLPHKVVTRVYKLLKSF